MKTNVAVFFGGRSVEHEISVISALQAINAFNKDKYNIIPIYISKQGRWFTGENLLNIRNYKDLNKLTQDAEEVFMRPEYGDYNLYKVNMGLFSKKNPIVAELHAVIPVLHGTNGEDGIFEGVLETIGIPFAGCNTLSSANGMDKITMKMILRECGIPVGDKTHLDDLKMPYVYLGPVSNRSMITELYARSTVVLSTSLFETLPGTIIEGMSAGCTPVTTGNGGQRDIVEHGFTGYITGNDSDEIASALIVALKVPFDRRLQHEAINSRFSDEVIAQRFIELLS